MMNKYSSHDFGAYQIDSYGNILTARNLSSRLLVAGQRLAKLNRRTIDNLKNYIPEEAIERIVTMKPEVFQNLLHCYMKH